MKRGSRNGLKRFFCKRGKHSFSIDHRKKPGALWIPYVDGIPLRKLGDELDLSAAQVYAIVKREMNQLPDNTRLSLEYGLRWSGRLCIDGKYVKVKGYPKKIPFIYGIDYLTHDIPVGILALAEDENAFLKLFRLLKTCKYPLAIVICDEVNALPIAMKQHFPKAKIQICQNHYLENLRQRLRVRTDTTYARFFSQVYRAFDPSVHYMKRNILFQRIYTEYKHDPVLRQILLEINARTPELFAFSWRTNNCPNTNNLIESFNSHIQGRLKSIKGFEKYTSAQRWLNAWMIRRRTKPFTDCGEPFKHLNRKCSLEMVLKKDVDFPTILGIKPPKPKNKKSAISPKKNT